MRGDPAWNWKFRIPNRLSESELVLLGARRVAAFERMFAPQHPHHLFAHRALVQVYASKSNIEALADAGVKNGLPRDVAAGLAAQTVFGASKLLLETREHPALLREKVTSPGGTTIAGLQTLETGGFRGTVMQSVDAATARSRELGKS